jgi:hypothetical protein
MSYHREGQLRKPPRPLKAECGWCRLVGPDEFGNFDFVENDRCPEHGPVGEVRELPERSDENERNAA